MTYSGARNLAARAVRCLKTRNKSKGARWPEGAEAVSGYERWSAGMLAGATPSSKDWNLHASEVVFDPSRSRGSSGGGGWEVSPPPHLRGLRGAWEGEDGGGGEKSTGDHGERSPAGGEVPEGTRPLGADQTTRELPRSSARERRLQERQRQHQYQQQQQEQQEQQQRQEQELGYSTGDWFEGSYVCLSLCFACCACLRRASSRYREKREKQEQREFENV